MYVIVDLKINKNIVEQFFFYFKDDIFGNYFNTN